MAGGNRSFVKLEADELIGREGEAAVEAAVIMSSKQLNGGIENFHALDVRYLKQSALTGPETLFKI